MNAEQTKNALSSIADSYVKDFKEKLEKLDPSHPTERKALHIMLNIAGCCSAFPQIMYNNRSEDDVLRVKRSHIASLHYFDQYLSAADALSHDENGSFIIFAHAVSMLKNAFVEQSENALNSKDESSAFAARLKLGVIRSVTREWYEWWRQNGCMELCDIITEEKR